MWFRKTWWAWLNAPSKSEPGKAFADTPTSLPNQKHVAGCGWWVYYRMVNTWLRRSRLLCFQSTVCRTRRLYRSWHSKSLHKSVLTAEAASLPRFTQTRTVASVWQPTGGLGLCDCATIWSNSPNQHKLGNTTGSQKYRFLPCPEIPAGFRFPGSFHRLLICKYSASFWCTCKALFLSFLCMCSC